MSAVQVDLSAVLSAWRRNDGYDIWLTLRSGPAADRTHSLALTDFAAALDAAWATWEPIADVDVSAEREAHSPKGFVFMLRRAATADGARRFLTIVADELGRHGFAGTITAAPQARLPRWLQDLSNHGTTPTPAASCSGRST